jgi:hypothetical protein
MLAIGLTGCSRSPVAPITDTSAAPSAGPMVIVDGDEVPPTDGGTPKYRTIYLTTTDEGIAVVGRFTLWVRKNSLKMPATITIRVEDPEATECQIEVTPPQANDFQSPVILYANMSDVPNFDYATGSMMVWTNDWEWATDTGSHMNQENVVGHFKKLFNTKVSDGADKWKNKIGA